MNVLATRRGSAHYPSMLEDVEAHRPTEIDLITGSLVREAERHGVPVPLHTALYRLVKAKEESWRDDRIRTSSAPGGVMTRRKTGAIAAVLATLTAVAAVAAASAPAAASDPIVIGWAFDGNGAMAPFDGPALAAAQIRVKQIERAGRGQRPAAPDRDLRHAGQQAGDRPGRARPGCSRRGRT